jgi:hypothetical protein
MRSLHRRFVRISRPDPMFVHYQIHRHDTELCVICGVETKVPRTQDVDERLYYVPGAGQLCHDCYQN